MISIISIGTWVIKGRLKMWVSPKEMGEMVTWEVEKAKTTQLLFCLSLHQQALQPPHLSCRR